MAKMASCEHRLEHMQDLRDGAVVSDSHWNHCRRGRLPKVEAGYTPANLARRHQNCPEVGREEHKTVAHFLHVDAKLSI